MSVILDSRTEPPPRRGYGAQTAFVVLGAFVLLCLPLTRAGKVDSPAKRELARLGSAPRLAVVGDSRAHAAIAPRLLRDDFAAAGLPEITGYNFAVDGTDLLHHRSFVVNDLLRAPHPPKVVIWAPNPLSFDGSRRQNLLEQLELADLVPLARAGAPLELLLDVATMRLFPPYGHRPVIQTKTAEFTDAAAHALLHLQEAAGLPLEPPSGQRIFTDFPDGHRPWHVVGNWRARFDRVTKIYTADYAKLSVSEWHLAVAEDFIRRVHRAGAVLVVVELPVAPTYRAVLSSTGKHLEWRRRLEELVTAEGGLWLMHADRYPRDEAFNDPAHMNDDTATDYSHFLAAELLRLPSVRAALASH